MTQYARAMPLCCFASCCLLRVPGQIPPSGGHVPGEHAGFVRFLNVEALVVAAYDGLYEESMHPATLAYLQLGGAILLEVIATSCLKQSEGMSRLVPTVTALVGYGFSFFLLSLVLKVIPMGVSYGIWSGVGIVIVSIIGLVFFGQKLDMAACIGLGFIVVGVLVINFFSSSVPH